MEITERLGKTTEISESTKGIYYSSWMYAAVHVALTIPHLRKINSLKEYLGITRSKILEVLHFLETHQLVIRQNDEFHPTQKWIRLDRKSPHVIKLHTNWKNKAILSLDEEKESDLHFSGIYSLDDKTAATIREALLDSISRQVKKIEQAPEKDLFVLNMDFFKLINVIN